MNCNSIKDQLIDYVENRLTQERHSNVAQHLKECDSCKREYIELQEFLRVLENEPVALPSENLKRNFDKALETEKQQQSKIVKLESNFNYKIFLKYAAGLALLISTFLFGRYQQKQQVAELKNERLSNKQTTMLALMENESASKRIQGVRYIEEFADPDPEIVDALVKRMLNDENTNVRLTAVNALEAFITSETVKDGFISALETEKDPTIQINIIKSLVKIQEKKALKPMQKLLEHEETQSFVKDEIKTVLTNNI